MEEVLVWVAGHAHDFITLFVQLATHETLFHRLGEVIGIVRLRVLCQICRDCGLLFVYGAGKGLSLRAYPLQPSDDVTIDLVIQLLPNLVSLDSHGDKDSEHDEKIYESRQDPPQVRLLKHAR